MYTTLWHHLAASVGWMSALSLSDGWCKHLIVSELNNAYFSRQISLNCFWVAKSYIAVCFNYFLSMASCCGPVRREISIDCQSSGEWMRAEPRCQNVCLMHVAVVCLRGWQWNNRNAGLAFCEYPQWRGVCILIPVNAATGSLCLLLRPKSLTLVWDQRLIM